MPLLERGTRFEVPAETLWEYISWIGVEKLAEGDDDSVAGVEFEGRSNNPGSIRIVHQANGPSVHERLEEYNEEDRFYRYRVIDSGTLPVTDYVGTVRVTPCGPDACMLKITCASLPIMVTEDEWRRHWEGLQDGYYEFMRERIEK